MYMYIPTYMYECRKVIYIYGSRQQGSSQRLFLFVYVHIFIDKNVKRCGYSRKHMYVCMYVYIYIYI